MLIRILFIGDVVGEAGLSYLERWLPAIIEKDGVRPGVLNAASRTAMPQADQPAVDGFRMTCS